MENKKLTIYLVGPIAGLTFEESNGWRDWVKDILGNNDFDVINPLDGKKHLFKDSNEICHPKNQKDEILTIESIFHKDIHNVRKSDILLMNLKGTNSLSFGSPFEWGVGYILGKVLVAVVDEDMREHPFIKCSSVYYDNLESSCKFIKSLKI